MTYQDLFFLQIEYLIEIACKSDFVVCVSYNSHFVLRSDNRNAVRFDLCCLSIDTRFDLYLDIRISILRQHKSKRTAFRLSLRVDS